MAICGLVSLFDDVWFLRSWQSVPASLSATGEQKINETKQVHCAFSLFAHHSMYCTILEMIIVCDDHRTSDALCDSTLTCRHVLRPPQTLYYGYVHRKKEKDRVYACSVERNSSGWVAIGFIGWCVTTYTNLVTWQPCNNHAEMRVYWLTNGLKRGLGSSIHKTMSLELIGSIFGLQNNWPSSRQKGKQNHEE